MNGKRIHATVILSIVVISVSMQGCDPFSFVFNILCSTQPDCMLALARVQNGGAVAVDQTDAPPTVHGIAVGNQGAVLTSIGRGSTVWSPGTSGTSQTLNYVSLLPYSYDGVTFAVGDSGTLLRTTDWGETWGSLSSGTHENLRYYDFFDLHNILVVGDHGIALGAGDPADSVYHYNTGSSRNLSSVIVNDAFIYIAVGKKGTILRTSNSGATWQDYSIPDTTIDFTRITRYGYIGYAGRMWAVGTKGTVYSSYDGTVWTPQNSGTGKTINDIHFRNVSEGGLFGDGGLIRYTTDGGDTWLSDPDLDSLTSADIQSVSMVDLETFSMLAGGSVLTASTKPLTDAGETKAQPSTFSLEQNYPNPFNPVTTFGFSIPRTAGSSGHVSLRIYDILGRNVATVSEEHLSPGRHERRFDASPLSTGVYIYRLTVSGTEDAVLYTATRKFVLVK